MFISDTKAHCSLVHRHSLYQLSRSFLNGIIWIVDFSGIGILRLLLASKAEHAVLLSCITDNI